MNRHIARWKTEKMELHDHLREVLSKAQEKYRKECEGLEWVEKERNAMFNEINRQRSARGLSPISLKELMRVESMACGHIDYSTKFALYCAELVLDKKVIEP